MTFPRINLAAFQWLLLVLGLAFLCAAGWVWLGVPLGLAGIGTSLILVAFLSTLAEEQR